MPEVLNLKPPKWKWTHVLNYILNIVYTQVFSNRLTRIQLEIAVLELFVWTGDILLEWGVNNIDIHILHNMEYT